VPDALHHLCRHLRRRHLPHVQRKLSLLLVCLLLWSCDRKTKEPADERPTVAPPKPKMLYIPRGPSDAVDLSQLGQPARGIGLDNEALSPAPGAAQCPPDMVLVAGSYCVDRYEAQLVDTVQYRLLSPHYPPSRRHTTSLLEIWQKQATTSRGILGRELNIPEPPSFQLDEDFEPRAESKPNALPSGYLTRGLAETACKNAGKRLCTRGEWVRACRGEQDRTYPYGTSYEERTCNVHRLHHPAQLLHGNSSRHHLDPRLNLTHDEDGPLLRHTGETERCHSTWGGDGIYDMVGNLDEWIVDVDGTFLGGFYARATTAGCEASIDSHDPGYLDYSLGTRCCRDLEP